MSNLSDALSSFLYGTQRKIPLQSSPSAPKACPSSFRISTYHPSLVPMKPFLPSWALALGFSHTIYSSLPSADVFILHINTRAPTSPSAIHSRSSSVSKGATTNAWIPKPASGDCSISSSRPLSTYSRRVQSISDPLCVD